MVHKFSPSSSNISEGGVFSSVTEIYSPKWISVGRGLLEKLKDFQKSLCFLLPHHYLLSQVMQEAKKPVWDLKTSLWYCDIIIYILVFVPGTELQSISYNS